MLSRLQCNADTGTVKSGNMGGEAGRSSLPHIVNSTQTQWGQRSPAIPANQELKRRCNVRDYAILWRMAVIEDDKRFWGLVHGLAGSLKLL